MLTRLTSIAVLAFCLLTGGRESFAEATPPDLQIEMFSSQGCPHCARAQRFLDALQRERPGLEIAVRDVGSDPAARRELARRARRHGVTPVGVPAFVIGDVFLVGFRDAAITGQKIRAALDQGASSFSRGPIEVPWFGRVDVEEVGLVASTILLGLLDGLNPCAMWVLLILLSVLVGIHDRRKLVVVAGIFVAVSGIAYFIFMAAWLNVFLWIGWSRPLQMLLGGVAAGVGAIHLKDAWALHRGPSLSIPESAKPGLYRRVRSILRARGLAAAALAALGLAVAANAVELLCTAGLPAVYTQILTMNDLSRLQYYGYLALYNLAYIADDLVLVSVSIVTMNRFKLQERHGRWLKGLSGSLMFVLGLILWFAPSWLTI